MNESTFKALRDAVQLPLSPAYQECGVLKRKGLSPCPLTLKRTCLSLTKGNVPQIFPLEEGLEMFLPAQLC